jgi:hypothetical protein
MHGLQLQDADAYKTTHASIRAACPAAIRQQNAVGHRLGV